MVLALCVVLVLEVIMAKIEGIRIRNFRALQDVTLGRLWNLQKAAPLTPMTAVIGKNGVGKSTPIECFRTRALDTFPKI